MASPKSTKRSNSRHKTRTLTYARREFGLGSVDLKSVAAIVAEAIGRPLPGSKRECWGLLDQFFNQDPAHRAERERAHKAVTDERRARKARYVVAPQAQPQAGTAVDVNSDAFLSSFEWRRLRMVVLKKRGARCECCGSTAKDGIRIHVDHIKPRRRFPELALTEANLQVLCEVCNHGKGSWDETDWRAVSQQSGESSADSPVTRSGDGDGMIPGAAFPRLVRRTQEGRGNVNRASGT